MTRTLRPTAVFDLDGTLADTAPDLIGAANALLRADDLPTLDPAAVRATAGRGGKALISLGYERAGRPLDRAAIDAKFPTYLRAYRDRIDAESRLFDGVETTLDALTAAGWRLTVCTNKPEDLARLLLRRIGLLDRFAGLVGADTLPVRKPDPRPVWEAIARAGGVPAAAVMIGDSKTDRDAARNAEIPVVMVSFGYAAEPLGSLKPDAIVDRFSALIDALPEAL